MIIRDVLGEESSEMALVQRDDVIEQIATTAADPAVRDTVLHGLRMVVCSAAIFIKRTATGTSHPYFVP